MEINNGKDRRLKILMRKVILRESTQEHENFIYISDFIQFFVNWKFLFIHNTITSTAVSGGFMYVRNVQFIFTDRFRLIYISIFVVGLFLCLIKIPNPFCKILNTKVITLTE